MREVEETEVLGGAQWGGLTFEQLSSFWVGLARVSPGTAPSSFFSFLSLLLSCCHHWHIPCFFCFQATFVAQGLLLTFYIDIMPGGAQETILIAGDWTQVNHVQESTLPGVLYPSGPPFIMHSTTQQFLPFFLSLFCYLFISLLYFASLLPQHTFFYGYLCSNLSEQLRGSDVFFWGGVRQFSDCSWQTRHDNLLQTDKLHVSNLIYLSKG